MSAELQPMTDAHLHAWVRYRCAFITATTTDDEIEALVSEGAESLASQGYRLDEGRAYELIKEERDQKAAMTNNKPKRRSIPHEDSPEAQAIAQAGYTLYGPRYQAALARALGVNSRMIAYWSTGRDSVPPARWSQIADLLEQRAWACWNLAPVIRNAGKQGH